MILAALHFRALPPRRTAPLSVEAIRQRFQEALRFHDEEQARERERLAGATYTPRTE